MGGVDIHYVHVQAPTAIVPSQWMLGASLDEVLLKNCADDYRTTVTDPTCQPCQPARSRLSSPVSRQGDVRKCDSMDLVYHAITDPWSCRFRQSRCAPRPPRRRRQEYEFRRILVEHELRCTLVKHELHRALVKCEHCGYRQEGRLFHEPIHDLFTDDRAKAHSVHRARWEGARADHAKYSPPKEAIQAQHARCVPVLPQAQDRVRGPNGGRRREAVQVSSSSLHVPLSRSIYCILPDAVAAGVVPSMFEFASEGRSTPAGWN